MGSLDVTRDVIYADDFAEAIVRMLVDDRPFETFNVGSDQRATVGDVVRLALQYANHMPAQIRCINEAATTVTFRALDCGKARAALNWSARTSLEEGIRQTTQWWQANKDSWLR